VSLYTRSLFLSFAVFAAWPADAAGLQFVPVTPCRVMDTRQFGGFAGAFGPPSVAAFTPRDVPIPTGQCGIPSSANAYSVNVTVVPLEATLGYLTLYPTGQSAPVSTLNAPTGLVTSNAAIVPAGTNGSISILVTNATDVIIDINGYFVPPSAGSLQFFPVGPCRVADTRLAQSTFGGPYLNGGAPNRDIPIPAGLCGIPFTAVAYLLNLTVVPRGPLGYLTAWPAGHPNRPIVSTLNSLDGSVKANAAIVPAGAGGAVSFFVTNDTDLVLDVSGYFAPPGPGGLNFFPLTPCRLVDTRFAASGFTGPLLAGQPTAFTLQGGCGLPASAQAYSLNVTVQPVGPLGFLTMFPGGLPPNASTLNSLNGLIVANAAIVPHLNGAVSALASDPTQLVIDTNGYFAP
jgi:hypothetical protein